MDFDYDIIKSFIPEEERKHFLVFENVYISGSKILAPYRALGEGGEFNHKYSIEELNLFLFFFVWWEIKK